jgi:hypothetical protein
MLPGGTPAGTGSVLCPHFLEAAPRSCSYSWRARKVVAAYAELVPPGSLVVISYLVRPGDNSALPAQRQAPYHMVSGLQPLAILEHMIEKRPEADRILTARLMGTAKRHALWREMTEAEQAPGVAALRELAAGRADLLAEVAGILVGASEGEPSEPWSVQAARLCRLAGADEEAIPAWIAEGRRRRAAAKLPPMSGGLHGEGA